MHSLDKYEEETAPNEKTIPAQKEARRDVKTSKGNKSSMVDVSGEESMVKSMPGWHERNPFHDAIHSTERLSYLILYYLLSSRMSRAFPRPRSPGSRIRTGYRWNHSSGFRWRSGMKKNSRTCSARTSTPRWKRCWR